MSEDKNELNQASKKQNSSNEKKLDLTDEAKSNKLETAINDEKKDTLSVEPKKSAGDSNDKNPKLLDGEKTLSQSDQEKTKINQNNTKTNEENQVEQKPSVKNASNKGGKTLTGPTNKTKKVNNLENKQTDAKFNNSEPNSKVNEQPEYIEKLVSINRVAKVVKGGRRFSFAALVVVGDGNGMVGHGKGKAKEVPEAIKKATDEAKTRMIRVPLRQGRTLHHDIRGRFDSGKVYLRSAPSGTGVIAGGPMRAVFEALGIQDIVAKSVGTSNPHNMVRATFEALKVASSPKIIATRRGLKINEITKRRKVSLGGVEGAKN